jgi:N-methylhydantoinase B
MAGALEPDVKWIMENRGENPGINKGDVFLTNDPWIGTSHQPDVMLISPIFVDNQIFAWSGLCQHQNDLGGSVAGSFCMNAADIWQDPQPIPAIRIVKGGKMDVEVLDLYMRLSRTPGNVNLDLRAALAGLTVMQNRVSEIIDEYGQKLVKGVLKLIIENSERAYLKKIATVPDGKWTQVSFIQGAMSGDRKAHRLVMTMEKKGTELTFSNEGTDPQIGSINVVFAAWQGAIMSMFSVMVLPEHMGAICGAMKHVHFNAVSGKIICPDYGAAVSPAGTRQTEMVISMANSLMSRMFLCSKDDSTRKLAMSSTPGHWPAAMGGGFKANGEFYVAPYGIDGAIGSSSATLSADGQFGGGVSWIPAGIAANVEENERDIPMLTLWRKMELHSSVPGKFISGEGGLIANTAHDGTHCPVFIVDEESPNTAGIFGLPGTRQEQIVIQNTNLKTLLEKGVMPNSMDEIEGERMKSVPVETAFGNTILDLGEQNGVFQWNFSSCSAMFDPLTREPEKVGKDVAADRYTKEQAEQLFGVVVKPDLSVDLALTASKREQMRKERLSKSVMPKGGK